MAIAELTANTIALGPKRTALRKWIRTFYPFQRAWVLDEARFSALDKSRQIGASHSYAGAAILWALAGETTTVISVGEREADETVDKCHKHVELLQKLGYPIAKSPLKSLLHLSNGGRVIPLPSTSGGRSFSGNVILDEFAYHKDPDAVWDAAAAVTMLGYKLRVLSTPNGVGNQFHKLITDPVTHAGYRIHNVTLEQALDDGYRANDDSGKPLTREEFIASCWKMAKNDPRVFDQLFHGTFLDNELQYIPSALINAALEDNTLRFDGETFAGLDIGRVANLTVLVIIRVDQFGNIWVQDVQRKTRTSDSDLDELALHAMVFWKCKRFALDATGMGSFPSERLVKKYGRKVEPVDFTMSVKEDLATGMYTKFADRKLKLPRSDQQLQLDIASIRRIVTTAGNVRYDAPVTDNGHADSAWALALALHAAMRPGGGKHEQTVS